MNAVDWGSVPEWVGGIGTVAAFIVALALLARELAAARVNEADRRRANEARRREQASQVAAWIEDTTASARFEVVVKNASPYPVFETAYFIAEADNRVADSPWQVLGTLGPGVERRQSYASDGQSIRGVNLSVRDNAGVRWRRAGNGELYEDLDPPPFC